MIIRGVIFDLGGVFFEDGTNKFLHLLSSKLKYKLEDLYPIFREGKSLEYRENKISGKEFFQWASKQLNSKIAPIELNQLWVSQYKEIDGMRNLVLWLKNIGIKVAVLSDNTPERVEYLQNKYHFLELFDKVIMSYEVNLTKTEPAIFQIALKRLSLKPEETVFVDDRQNNLDVAKRLNMKTVLFADTESLKETLLSYLAT
jgi:epoxide hydrolase-like predicted phosphatase